MKINNKYIKPAFIFLNSILYFFLIDFCLTKLYGVNGYHKFFESNRNVGYINKRNFIGRFGGPLDEFSNIVKIDRFGNRYSLVKKCSNFKYENIKNNVLFVGDSTLAGFEVSDDKTYVSRLNKNCGSSLFFINGGVRGHDTHMAMANLERLVKEKNLSHDNTKYFYMLTSNDFKENNNKNSYFGMKANFGSIYDSKFYKPYVSPIKLNLKKFLANNFYFLKKFRRYFLSIDLKLKKNIPISNLNQVKSVPIIKNNNIDNVRKKECERVIEIVSKTIKTNKLINNIYIISHPSLSDDLAFLRDFQEQENCLYKASKDKKGIFVIKISNKLKDLLKNKEINLSLRFKKDSHYNNEGHLFFAKLLNEVLKSY